MQMYCSHCGLDRTVSNAAADPGACPKCGNTARCSWKPQWTNALVTAGTNTFANCTFTTRTV